MTLTLDWYFMIISGEEEIIDETDMEDTVFEGKWAKGGLWASGPATIHPVSYTHLDVYKRQSLGWRPASEAGEFFTVSIIITP